MQQRVSTSSERRRKALQAEARQAQIERDLADPRWIKVKVFHPNTDGPRKWFRGVVVGGERGKAATRDASVTSRLVLYEDGEERVEDMKLVQWERTDGGGGESTPAVQAAPTAPDLAPLPTRNQQRVGNAAWLQAARRVATHEVGVVNTIWELCTVTRRRLVEDEGEFYDLTIFNSTGVEQHFNIPSRCVRVRNREEALPPLPAPDTAAASARETVTVHDGGAASTVHLEQEGRLLAASKKKKTASKTMSRCQGVATAIVLEPVRAPDTAAAYARETVTVNDGGAASNVHLEQEARLLAASRKKKTASKMMLRCQGEAVTVDDDAGAAEATALQVAIVPLTTTTRASTRLAAKKVTIAIDDAVLDGIESVLKRESNVTDAIASTRDRLAIASPQMKRKTTRSQPGRGDGNRSRHVAALSQ